MSSPLFTGGRFKRPKTDPDSSEQTSNSSTFLQIATECNQSAGHLLSCTEQTHFDFYALSKLGRNRHFQERIGIQGRVKGSGYFLIRKTS